jgi:hypothetical protein
MTLFYGSHYVFGACCVNGLTQIRTHLHAPLADFSVIFYFISFRLSVLENFPSQDQMAKDFGAAFVKSHPESNNLFDVTFLVGDKGKPKKKLFGVRAILGVRSRVFQEMLYGISTVFGSPQVGDW